MIRCRVGIHNCRGKEGMRRDWDSITEMAWRASVFVFPFASSLSIFGFLSGWLSFISLSSPSFRLSVSMSLSLSSHFSISVTFPSFFHSFSFCFFLYPYCYFIFLSFPSVSYSFSFSFSSTLHISSLIFYTFIVSMFLPLFHCSSSPFFIFHSFSLSLSLSLPLFLPLFRHFSLSLSHPLFHSLSLSFAISPLLSPIFSITLSIYHAFTSFCRQMRKFKCKLTKARLLASFLIE